MKNVIFWDFDGTLAFRKDLWSGALMDVLDERQPGHAITQNDLKGGLHNSFPWHKPERPHPELSDPKAWWALIEDLLARTFEGAGIDPERAAEYAHLTHLRYADPDGYQLFDDTRPVLEALSARSWEHVILSNHVPELQAIVTGLGLDDLIPIVITSALAGYEKPHPRIFEIAREAAGYPGKVWMIGDNPVADLRGGERAGIPAVLVRTEDASAKRSTPTLEGLLAIVD